MLKHFGIRLLDAVPTVLFVITLVFVALRLLPGDPAEVVLGEYATGAQMELFREQMGLNAPLWQQYLVFIRDVVTFDLGTSLASGRAVADIIAANLPYTIELTIAAMFMGILFGIPMGVSAAVNRNGLPDTGSRIYALLGYAIPDFYLGAVLLIVFSLNLGWFPISGAGEGFADRLHHLFLPAFTLAVVKSSFISRLTRASLLEALNKDFVRTAHAKGARERRVVYRHGLRNAMLPITTGLGLSALATLSGSVPIELVFNRPGVGSLLINAITERDYPVIQGGVVVFAMFVVVINLLIDVAYLAVDPRVRIS